MCGKSRTNIVTTLDLMKQTIDYIRESRFFWADPDKDIDHRREWADIARLYDTLSNDDRRAFDNYVN